MSRGFGKLQTALLGTIRLRRKPMTFEDIRGACRQAWELEERTKLSPSFERSLRRALQGLVRAQVLVVIGQGGRGDPGRYFLHPVAIGMICDEPEMRELMKAFGVDVEPTTHQQEHTT